jgi:hypothetical protein
MWRNLDDLRSYEVLERLRVWKYTRFPGVTLVQKLKDDMASKMEYHSYIPQGNLAGCRVLMCNHM